jgi:hypothetical protein
MSPISTGGAYSIKHTFSFAGPLAVGATQSLADVFLSDLTTLGLKLIISK